MLLSVGRYAIQRARKEYKCVDCEWHRIKVGDLYLYSAMPPWHEMHGARKKSDPLYRKWRIERSCIRCAKEFGLLCSDTRKQLEEKQNANSKTS